MRNEDSKLLVGLIVGAVVGAAVGYLAASEKKEQLIEELNSIVGKVKDGVNTAVTKYKEGRAAVAEKIDEVTE